MNRKQRKKIDVRTALLVAIPVCVLIVALVFLVRLFGSFQSDPAETQDQPSAETSGQTDLPSASQPELPEGLDLPAQTVGGLTLYYADGALQRVDGEGSLVTLLPDLDEPTVRLDMQPLNGSIQDLEQAEIQRLAVGLLQSYYVDAPETSAITAAADESLQYAWSLEAPATGDAPALSARVRFLEASDGLWYLLLLRPSAEKAPDALTTAYETAAAR